MQYMNMIVFSFARSLSFHHMIFYYPRDTSIELILLVEWIREYRWNDYHHPIRISFHAFKYVESASLSCQIYYSCEPVSPKKLPWVDLYMTHQWRQRSQIKKRDLKTSSRGVGSIVVHNMCLPNVDPAAIQRKIMVFSQRITTCNTCECCGCLY
jgi:hypothetical protein